MMSACEAAFPKPGAAFGINILRFNFDFTDVVIAKSRRTSRRTLWGGSVFHEPPYLVIFAQF